MTTLRKGSKGAEVEVLQKALNLHGANLTVDGDFGDKTLKAVINYQQNNGLTPDGVVGPKTWDKLQSTDVLKVIKQCVDDISTLPSFLFLVRLMSNE